MKFLFTFIPALLAILFLSGCQAWKEERVAAYETSVTRAEQLNTTARTLSGASTKETTTTSMGKDGRPVIQTVTNITPGTRNLVSVGLSLEPGAKLELVNTGTGVASLSVDIAEPAASMMNATSDMMRSVSIPRDTLMEDTIPAAVNGAVAVSALGGAIYGTSQIVKNAKQDPVIVNQPPPVIVEQPAL